MKRLMLNRSYLHFGLLLLLLLGAAPSSTAHAAPAQSAPAQAVAAPIDLIVQVQPIIVSNDDGTETARSFGGGPGDALYESIIAVTKDAWAQAGIHVIFLPAKQWNNTLANFGDPCQYDGHTGTGTPEDPCTGGNRFHDADTVIQAAEDAGIASVGLHSSILDLYFLRVDPGWPNWTSFTGAGRQKNNSMILGIGDDGWIVPREVGQVIAHETGHNLGLNHPEDDPDFPGYPNNPCPDYNLMTIGSCLGSGALLGFDLVAEQIAKARQGSTEFAVPIPVPALPVAKTVVNNTLLAVQNMSIRKDVKAALLLTLEATKLILKNNQPLKACKAMKLFDYSVAYFLSKGKLTDSQGRLLNTASKDIRAAIGCQSATSVTAAEALFAQAEAVADNGEADVEAIIRQLLADLAAEENGPNTTLFLPLITK